MKVLVGLQVSVNAKIRAFLFVCFPEPPFRVPDMSVFPKHFLVPGTDDGVHQES
jgi:hypothetical protein